MAARPVSELFEFLYVDPGARLDPEIPWPANGELTVPHRPGLGFEPDPEILKRYIA